MIGELVAPDQPEKNRDIDHVEGVEDAFGQLLRAREEQAQGRCGNQRREREDDPWITQVQAAAELGNDVQREDEQRDRPLRDGNGSFAADVLLMQGLGQAS